MKTESTTEVEREVELIEIPMNEIATSKSNDIYRDYQSKAEKQAIEELKESIKIHGLINPITVRFAYVDGEEPGSRVKKYEIISGERRFLACQELEWKVIPATVRQVSTEQALEIQLEENLKRLDIHPLDEALGFARLMKDFYPNEGDTLIFKSMASKFAKRPEYIARRIQLTKLIPDFQKDFRAGKMDLGAALELCRLSEADQKQAKKLWGSSRTWDREEALDYIDRHVQNNLDGAPFPKNVEVAGCMACNICTKHTKANTVLFSDMQGSDLCMDKACFEKKTLGHTLDAIKDAIENKPDVVFLIERYNQTDKKIADVINKHEIKPLSRGDQFDGWDAKGPKVTGIWINGDRMGHTDKVQLNKGSKSAEGKPKEQVETSVAIDNIKARQKRNVELDQEKVYVQVLEIAKKHEAFKLTGSVKKTRHDIAAQRWMIIQLAGFDLADQILKKFKIDERIWNAKPGEIESMIEKIIELPEQAFIQIARAVMLDKFAGQAPNVRSVEGQIIMRLAMDFFEGNVNEIQKAQDEIAAKRTERVAERIKKLKTESKSEKKSTPKKKKS